MYGYLLFSETEAGKKLLGKYLNILSVGTLFKCKIIIINNFIQFIDGHYRQKWLMTFVAKYTHWFMFVTIYI